MKLGIIGAMDVEVSVLKEHLRCAQEHYVAETCYCEGILEGMPAVVVQCGVGKVNAAICTQILCDRFGVTHIVNTGVAGSLCAELDIGDFVISKDAMYHDFDCHPINPAYPVGQVPGLSVHAFPAEDTMVRCAFAAAEQVHPGHAKLGRIASGDQFVSSRQAKEKIVKDTQALCTEMEGAAIAHCAWRNGIPFVVIRAISDKADDSAHMDYPSFEAMAAKRCAAVTMTMARMLCCDD